jgi:hypothetical protein
MVYGPKKPPRLPIELISPMLAAAALAPRKLLGIAHSEGYAATTPANPTEKRTSAADRFTLTRATPASAAAPAKRGIAVCHLRSPVRSECQPNSSITGTATSAGIAVYQEVCTAFRCPTRCSIFGIHRPKP